MDGTFGSAIVTSANDSLRLRTWLEEAGTPAAQPSLLYRASRDGWQGTNFHSRCDDRGPTLTVVQDIGGHVFGGFSSASWSSAPGHPEGGSFCRSPRSFIFVLRTHGGDGPLRMPLKPGCEGQAVCHHSEWGPCFGYDLCVLGDANSNTDSSTFVVSASPIENCATHSRLVCHVMCRLVTNGMGRAFITSAQTK